MISTLNDSWQALLSDELEQSYFKELIAFVDNAYDTTQVFPPKELIFNAFNLVNPEDVKVVIIGQDPYHGEGEANGLSFSVNNGVKMPPSLRNIFKEVAADTDLMLYPDTDLRRWAKQGVFLLNSTLTVEANKAGSHQGHGWEQFTDAVINRISCDTNHVVFLLWGKFAWQKEQLIDDSRHKVLKAVHPSPLSAYRGFFGCHHFTLVNTYLKKHGKAPIDWR